MAVLAGASFALHAGVLALALALVGPIRPVEDVPIAVELSFEAPTPMMAAPTMAAPTMAAPAPEAMEERPADPAAPSPPDQATPPVAAETLPREGPAEPVAPAPPDQPPPVPEPDPARPEPVPPPAEPPPARPRPPEAVPRPAPRPMQRPAPRPRPVRQPAAPAPAPTEAPRRAAPPGVPSAPPPAAVPPPSAPASAAPAQPSGAWRGALAAWVQSRKRYPEEARRLAVEGTVGVRFTVSRDGAVLDPQIIRPSGSDLLDRAALAMFQGARAPAFPADMAQQQVSITVAIRYRITE